MAKFYFHVVDDLDTADDEGADLHDIEAARAAARTAARSMMCETLMRDGRISLHHFIEVQDEDRNTVSKVTFGDAIHIEATPRH